MKAEDFRIIFQNSQDERLIEEIMILFNHFRKMKGFSIFEKRNRNAKKNDNIMRNCFITFFDIESPRKEKSFELQFHFALLAVYDTFEILQPRIRFSISANENNTSGINNVIWKINQLINNKKSDNGKLLNIHNVNDTKKINEIKVAI